MKIKLLIICLILTVSSPVSRADEGMWIPILIEKYNIKLMREKGFKLSPEDIYSVNKASMKDAVLIFGGGCTGEIISGEGLLITNHHCGHGMIQNHSSLEHDYLTDGFWAMSRKEELPNPGLTITILKRMEDVTDKVLKGITDELANDQRDKIIADNISLIQKEAVRGTGYRATVRPFYMGNQYFLFIDEIFSDIRLVGAPPSSIGKFGGDTDNWMWPRHTGDFSVFRIYANKNNNPAPYSKDNVPYKPAYHFPISIKGVKEGDFTLVFGYPGVTYQYVPSYHVEMLKNYIYPKLIDIRTQKIAIINEAMNEDPAVRIKYSSKVAGISNVWKKWIGEIQGLDRMNTIEEKRQDESSFVKWVNQEDVRVEKYGSIIQRYNEIYDTLKVLRLVYSYTSEVLDGSEAIVQSGKIHRLAELYYKNSGEEEIKASKDRILAGAVEFFKDYDIETDKKLFSAVMKMYGENLDKEWLAPGFLRLKRNCNGDFEKLAGRIYGKSLFTDESRFNDFVTGFSASSLKKLGKDPFYSIWRDVSRFIGLNVSDDLLRLNTELQHLNRKYMAAQMEFDSGRIFYPDANFTLRVAFGEVQGYKPKDAVIFNHFTTLGGIMEKDNPSIYDYDVPDKLKELYANSDFGRYAQNGEVPVCFIADNHTTGGNSGSPVINADGHLIGINFDRAWDGVASDMAFNPELSRNISLDIRFALFIIDKFAGAGYLLEEMTIIE